jgi:hypothetical protein
MTSKLKFPYVPVFRNIAKYQIHYQKSGGGKKNISFQTGTKEVRACAGISWTIIAQDSRWISRRRRRVIAGTMAQGSNEESRREDKQECSSYFCAGH